MLSDYSLSLSSTSSGGAHGSADIGTGRTYATPPEQCSADIGTGTLISVAAPVHCSADIGTSNQLLDVSVSTDDGIKMPQLSTSTTRRAARGRGNQCGGARTIFNSRSPSNDAKDRTIERLEQRLALASAQTAHVVQRHIEGRINAESQQRNLETAEGEVRQLANHAEVNAQHYAKQAHQHHEHA